MDVRTVIAQMVYCFIRRGYDIKGACIVQDPSEMVSRILGVYLFLWNFFIVMSFYFARISIKLRKYDTAKAASNRNVGKAMVTISGSCANARNDQTNAVNTETFLHESANQGALEASRSRKVAKTLVFVFLAYVCCWSTNQILFLQ